MRAVLALVLLTATAAADDVEPRPDVDVHAVFGVAPLPVRTPSLEPHLPLVHQIAAEIGTWTGYCTAEKRSTALPGGHATLEYLSAWCTARGGDRDGAIAELAALRDSKVGSAAIEDAVDLAADAHGAADAIALLARAGVDAPTVLDELAADYVAAGRDDEARRVVRAERDLGRARCDTIVRLASLGSDVLDDALVIASHPDHSRCEVRVQDAVCLLGFTRCYPPIPDPGHAEIAAALLGWGDARVSWSHLANGLVRSHEADAVPLAVAALRNAARVEPCDRGHLRIALYRNDTSLPPELVDEIDDAVANYRDRCPSK
jgi:hypothetical protein